MHYEQQVKEGKTHNWAFAYADMRTQDKSHEEAEAYANDKYSNS